MHHVMAALWLPTEMAQCSLLYCVLGAERTSSLQERYLLPGAETTVPLQHHCFEQPTHTATGWSTASRPSCSRLRVLTTHLLPVLRRV